MHILLNLVLFQIAWVVTVAGAGAGYWWAGLVATAVLAAVVFKLSPWPRTDFALLCVACLVGVVIDSAYVQLGLLRYVEPVPFGSLAPIWIIAMWMSFALTLNHSMRFFKGKPLLSAVFGLVGGPLAYWVAQSKFAAVEFLMEPFWVFVVLGIAWAAITPLLLHLASMWLPRFDPAPGT